MRHGKRITCLMACGALYAGAAWGTQPAAGDARKNGTHDHAWTVNGMQVIEITPAQRSAIHAERQPDGSLVIRHSEPKQQRTGE